jgi:endonuclease/exonuclease/phosphatase family metal-dependent hydrolase
MSLVRVLSYDVNGLRGDRAAMDAMVRELAPDVVLVHGAPRRFRWRTRCADLADRFGLVYAGGGEPSLGNLVLVHLRVALRGVRYIQFPLVPGELARGGVVTRCEVAGRPRVLASAQLAAQPRQRQSQAALFAAALSDVEGPVIASVDGGAAPEAQRLTEAEGRTEGPGLTDGRTVAGSAGRATIIVDPAIDIERCEVVDTPGARLASIHLPMVADLRLPVPAGTGPMVSA